MSHTLHRVAGADMLSDDYVILVMASVSYNKDASTPGKYKEHLKIMLRHNPVNLGGMGIGHLKDSTPEEILSRIDSVFPNLPMVHGVFQTREDLVAALKEMTEQGKYPNSLWG